MRGSESFSDRSKWEPDREALLGDAERVEHEAAEDDKPPIHPIRMRAFFVAAILTVTTSSLGILTTLSQTGGGYKYDYATIPFLAELLKFLVCGYLLWKEFKSPQSAVMTTKWSSILLYPIPSIIYLVHNNVQFLTLTYVDTSTHQIMGNLKIVTTGILFRTFLKRKLSRLQWMAIMLLTIGTTVSQVKGCGETNCGRLLAAPIQGYLLGILSACLSALAGVYTEYLMKKNQDSLYWQNMQLYAFGVLFNIARLTVDDIRTSFSKGPWWYRLFNGYDFVTWMVVLNLGFTGLLVSWVMKYADNIVKVYATSMAMLLTMVISIQLFNFKPTLQLFLGILICGMSLQLYYTPVEVLVGTPTSPPSPSVEANSNLDLENATKKKSSLS
ncbi:hypothetical protein M758_1G061100 [Ceratodon purpureus]|uniref:Uncharacterized protein n=1 Tax=Ceratodon purpureus TaxID=3225 RepID=A0A8T0J456_CERPU|nr:hypothetical protein KC19_1G062100 [Ceratodon purpureus]KAG0628903.1 hypothetical protein M758_1G061100 [Ceratodon purpureus]